MSPPGRPKGEFRNAQHEGTPVSPSFVDALLQRAEQLLARLELILPHSLAAPPLSTIAFQ